MLTCKERLIPYYARFGFEDEGVSEIRDLCLCHRFGQGEIDARHPAVLQNEIAVGMDAQGVQGQRFQDVALDGRQHGPISSFRSMSFSSLAGTCTVRSRSLWAAIT